MSTQKPSFDARCPIQQHSNGILKLRQAPSSHSLSNHGSALPQNCFLRTHRTLSKNLEPTTVVTTNNESNRKRRAGPDFSNDQFKSQQEKAEYDSIRLAYEQTFSWEKRYERSRFSFSFDSISGWKSFDSLLADTPKYIHSSLFKQVSSEFEMLLRDTASGVKILTSENLIKHHHTRLAGLKRRIQGLERMHDVSSFPFSAGSINEWKYFEMECVKIDKMIEQLKKLKINDPPKKHDKSSL
ncbi:hypothetical protein B9Z55_023467 [Caenorhabditis nigoni]|nr:hypothetical protein B9Z55_023467 [Caenorhabditis nigoni]